MPTISPQEMIDMARGRHSAFADAGAPDGVLWLELKQRIRSLLLKYVDSIGKLEGTAVSVLPTLDPPRFVLPADLVAVLDVELRYADGTRAGLDVIEAHEEHEGYQGRHLAAVVRAGALHPVRSRYEAPFDDAWVDVESVRLDYLAAPAFPDLDTVTDVPDVLLEALIAHLAKRLAMGAKGLTPFERAEFVKEALRAEDELEELADRMVGTITERRVQYRG
jgi:hypothetical protein